MYRETTWYFTHTVQKWVRENVAQKETGALLCKLQKGLET